MAEMKFNGPEDAARCAIESEQECRKLERLLAEQTERRDLAKTYLTNWFERPPAVEPAITIEVAGETYSYPNGEAQQ
jgi:hypothetical protein